MRLTRRKTTAGIEMQHYNRILLSDDMQSFTLEQNHIPVLQIDLLPLPGLDFPSSPEFTKQDYAINYLYRESFRDPDVFKRAIYLFTSFVFTYPDIRYLFLKLPQSDPALAAILELTGFELVYFNIYKITRANVQSIHY